MAKRKKSETVADEEHNLNLDANEVDVQVLVAAGQEYYRRGMLQSAEKVFRGAYVLSKGSPAILRFIGTTLHAQMRIDEALACYEQALVDLPEDPQLWYNKGELLVLNGEGDAATSLLRRTLEETRDHRELAELHQRAEAMLAFAAKLKEIAGTDQEAALTEELSAALTQAMTGEAQE